MSTKPTRELSNAELKSVFGGMGQMDWGIWATFRIVNAINGKWAAGNDVAVNSSSAPIAPTIRQPFTYDGMKEAGTEVEFSKASLNTL